MEENGASQSDDGRGSREGRATRLAATGVLVAGLLGWLWPIGLGGRMPVGGDVTRFSIGLMAELGRSIRAGRIPYWNDLWGYGFPGLAESQAGVYYPPHLLLYGILPVEVAYTVVLVLHTLWAGLGASWAARRFGTSPRGAALTGFAWATCGFFLIHLPHQWGATTASWMPWAWGLAWMTTTGAGGRRAPMLLAAAVAVQILPGHFQLAFNTEVIVVLLGVCGLLTRGAEGVARWRRAVALGLALAAVLPLALAQLGPTAELAGLAGSARDPDYLSAFATPPLHLVSYVAPGLFHRSPLWRPLAWDAFHAMPEEHLATIGLVPLFLAWVAVRNGRRDPRVRALLFLAASATFLSLGPYVPGFATLCGLPGFSFFRAPARWGAAAMLALSLLAGRGLDALPTLDRPGWRLRRFVLVSAAIPALVVGLFEVALAANEPAGGRPAWPGVAAGLDRGFRLLPWRGEPPLSARLTAARRPLDDLRVPVAHARQGLPWSDPADRTLVARRGAIYAREMGPTCVLLMALLAVSTLAGRGPRAFERALLAILLVEALYWSRQRPFDLGPVRPLADQSPLMAWLSALPRGTRSADPAGNLAMAAGVAPISAYRTLDLPIQLGLNAMAVATGSPGSAAAALRAEGAGVRVFEDGNPPPLPGWTVVARIVDPTLFGWLTGADWARQAGEAGATYTVWRPDSEPTRAWLVSSPASDLARKGDDPASLLARLAQAKPLGWKSSRPEAVRVEVSGGPGTVVVSQLDYPRWRARLTGSLGEGRAVPIVPVLGGWQGVDIPSGSWTLDLEYDVTRDRACLAASGLAWTAWVLVYWRSRRRDVKEMTR